ncbi:hypothetical protein IPdc08_01553 [archaeon]|nr:hypothetical protein IPdc08_01553 [archaeon]
MNKKALFTGALTLLVLFAVLPAANAVVLDPSGCPAGNSTAVLKLYKEYNTTYQACMNTPGLVPASLKKKYNVSYSGITNVLKNKPVSNLTWAEAYYMSYMYSSSDGGKSSYSPSKYNKIVEYVNQMISVQNTPQSRALGYIEMETAADSMYGATNNPKWLQKQTYFNIMILQNNPNGIVNDGGFDWNNSTWWDGVDLTPLQRRGYNVPQKAIDFVNKAWNAARAGKLNTQAQLTKIGFYQWKKKYLIPIVNEKVPQKSIPTKIADTLPGILNFISKYGSDLAKGIGGIFILSIVLLVLKRRRDNRYY